MSDKKEYTYMGFETRVLKRFKKNKPTKLNNTEFLRQMLRLYKGSKK